MEVSGWQIKPIRSISCLQQIIFTPEITIPMTHRLYALLLLIVLTPLLANAGDILLKGSIENDAQTPLKESVRINAMREGAEPSFIPVKPDGTFSTNISVTDYTLYKLTYNRYYVLFLLSPADTLVRFKIADKTDFRSLQVENSNENDAYFSFRDKLFALIDSVKDLRQMPESAAKEERGRRILEEHNQYCNTIRERYPNTFASDFLAKSFEMPKATAGTKMFSHFQANFFSNLDFADPKTYLSKDINLILTDYIDFIADSSAPARLAFFENTFKKAGVSPKASKELLLAFIEGLTYGARENWLVTYADFLKKHPDLSALNPVADERIKMVRQALPGVPAHEITGKDPMGNDKSLSQVVKAAKLTLLVFWEPGCNHCQMMMPEFQEAYARLKAKGFEVFAVSIGKDEAEWKAFIEKNKLVWNNIISPTDPSVYTKYYIQSTPTMVFIGNNGKIVSRFFSDKDFKQTLNRLMK